MPSKLAADLKHHGLRVIDHHLRVMKILSYQLEVATHL
jgi:hypothetical protein